MRQSTLILGTERGVMAAARSGSEWRLETRVLAGHHVSSITSRSGVIVAGTNDGIFRSEDGGKTWQETGDGLTVRHVRWLATVPDAPAQILAGTEPAAIFASHDSGLSWRECSEVAQLRSRYGWSLPYSPEAGCVRGFAAQGGRVYAAVEVGGVLRSGDGGESWSLAAGSDGIPRFSTPQGGLVHPDVHSIVVHPSSGELVFAATGGGLYHSSDGGKTWQCLYQCYCRAVWVDPADAAHLILGPADGVSRNGRIEESHDGGRSWHGATGSLLVPWPHHMVERFVQNGRDLLAILSNGEVLATELPELAWRSVFGPEAGVQSAVFVD